MKKQCGAMICNLLLLLLLFLFRDTVQKTNHVEGFLDQVNGQVLYVYSLSCSLTRASAT